MSFSDPRKVENASENINNGFESQRDFDSNTLKYSNFSQENKLSTFFDANNLDSGERYESNGKLNYDIKNEEEFENLQYESENYKVYVNNEDYSHDFNLNQDYDNNTFSNNKERNLENKNEKFQYQEKEGILFIFEIRETFIMHFLTRLCLFFSCYFILIIIFREKNGKICRSTF